MHHKSVGTHIILWYRKIVSRTLVIFDGALSNGNYYITTSKFLQDSEDVEIFKTKCPLQHITWGKKVCYWRIFSTIGRLMSEMYWSQYNWIIVKKTEGEKYSNENHARGHYFRLLPRI